jgi:hypothetical protein
MRELLIQAGFTDVVQNEDGTFNGTKNGHRYEKLYIKNVENEIREEEDCLGEVVVLPVQLRVA